MVLGKTSVAGAKRAYTEWNLTWSIYSLITDMQWIIRSPWLPSSRFSMTIRLILSAAANLLGLPLQAASPAPGVTVHFSSYREYFSLFREIFVKQEYSISLANPSPLIMDCGANIGLAAIYFKTRFPNARVIAFEPNPSSFTRLASNIGGNKLKQVELRNEAVCGRTGVATLVRPKGTSESHAASLMLAEGSGAVADSDSVSCVRLSSVIEELPPIDLLKIDIEGAEYEVLTDLEYAGQFHRIGALIIEYHEGIASAPIDCALSLLRRNGFHCRIAADLKPWHSLDRPYGALIYAVRRESMNRNNSVAAECADTEPEA